MVQRRFAQVDVFTSVPYYGNPLAVVLDGDGLTDQQLQRFASWTNLSETTFLLPPTDPSADYLVRIFTASQELPFAGHPTLGSAHVWLSYGGAPKQDGVVVQECRAGLVEIRRTDDGLAFAAPPLTQAGTPDEADVVSAAAALGIDRAEILDAQWAVNGPRWLAVRLASAQAVLAVVPQPSDLDVGLIGFHPSGSECLYEVRAFFPANGLPVEDPVTGSLNAGIAQWLVGSGEAVPPYVAAQGTALGRAGRVHVSRTGDGRIWIGGTVTTCIHGTVEL